MLSNNKNDRKCEGSQKPVILVTGAAGFIGYHVSQALLEKGYRVVGIDHLNDYYDVRLKEARLQLLTQNPLFTYQYLDIVNQEDVNELFVKHSFPIVIHLAAQAGVRYSIDHPDKYMNSNIMGFFHILEACRKTQPDHLIFASSSSVYGNQSKVPFAITDMVDQPISLYAATKKSNELMAYTYSHLFQIPVTGLRFFTVYGPFGRPDMAYFKFVQAIKRDEPITIYNHGDLYRDFTYIDDIVAGIVSLVEKGPKESAKTIVNASGAPYHIYNIGNHKPVSLMHFVATLEDLLQKKGQKIMLPMQDGDVYQTYADVSAFTEDYGFTPHTSMEEGLTAFVAWYENFYEKFLVSSG